MTPSASTRSSILLAMAIGLIPWLMAACGARSAEPLPVLGTGPLDSAGAYLQRGDEYAARQEYVSAIADYTEALRLRPDWAEAYNNRGYSYWWNGDGDQALADYNRALELRPQYAYAYNNRGVLYMAGGHPNEAIVEFTQALAIQPDFPQAYSNRGNAYLRLGRLGLALADFRAAGHDYLLPLLLVCGGSAAIAALAVFRWSRRRRSPIKPAATR